MENLWKVIFQQISFRRMCPASMILFPIQNITQAYTEFRDFIANIVKQI